jgi:zinc transporter, ZIP family
MGGAVLLAAAVVVGQATASGFSEQVLAVALAFAGGAVLASLADTLMPEAFEHGRPLDTFANAAGVVAVGWIVSVSDRCCVLVRTLVR